MLVIGLMSGTSTDGTDAVLVRISGAPPTLKWHILAHSHLPHPPELREQIFTQFRPETSTVDALCRLNFKLGEAFGRAALQVISESGVSTEEVDLIGSHGQTLWHIPPGQEGASTLQLGEPAIIAEMTGIPVVSNFRTRDMAAGGQGAPLVAYVDKLLLTDPTQTRAAQNIGGIANVTYLPPLSGGVGEAFAFDTGPGNMLIDYTASRASEGALQYDRDGLIAAAGAVHEQLLEELLSEPYFSQQPPKTTGRELFGAQLGKKIWKKAMRTGLAPQDVVATMTAFTAESIARAYRYFLPAQPQEVIVSGGGSRNPTLMCMLAARLAPARLLQSDDLGLASESKEALAFAILAYETWHGRPGNLPAATGASHPVVLGSLTPGGERAWNASSPGGSLTEADNPHSAHLDELDAVEIVELMNNQDALVPLAIAQAAPAIGRAVQDIASRMKEGGRLIYLGAGTSGRLGVLDASECPPTFGIEAGRVLGIIAGGDSALRNAIENAEDQPELGEADLRQIQLTAQDSVVGITASGATPYVIGGLHYAHQIGALTAAIVCNRHATVTQEAEITILIPVGPEVISGSTRLKAGTAQKMVLNMISTGVMVSLGKTYGNLMVDVKARNAKLRKRAVRLVQQITGVTPGRARSILERCDWEVKTAVVCQERDCNPQEARKILVENEGRLRSAIIKED